MVVTMGTQYCSWLLRFLLPSLWEAEVAISAAALLAATVALLVILDQTTPTISSPPSSPTTEVYGRDSHSRCRRQRRSRAKRSNKALAEPGRASEIEIAADGSPSRGTTTAYAIKVELVSAKYLIGANLNGTSEPYAVISLGRQKRFTSMVPSSRNPVWGEGFNFLVAELPAEVTITIYDWDNVCKCKVIGSVTLAILGKDETGATWYDLDSRSGSIRYKFTSFWNRNRTFRSLETALQSYRATLDAEKQVRSHLLPNGESMNVISSRTDNIKTEDRSIELAITYQPFINEHVLVDVTSNTFPGTPEKFFTVILGDNAMFFQQYRDARKDTDLKLSKWHVSDVYGGNFREVTFRSLCNSPLCPPDTAVTELQRASFSKDKRNLIYETKQQAHDVPFGSYFEIHCRWSLRTTSSSTCQVDIKIGVNMKKWCILQSKIKSGATDEYRREVCKILEAASDYALKAESNDPASDDTVATSSA
ncbi:hypothetical protein ACQ4PT_029735 [Festuca glaucescens]